MLCPSRANIRLIQSYDPTRSLRTIWLPAQLKDGLFDVPSRKRVQKRYAWLFRRYPALVTTETTSTRLKDDPRFRALLIRIRHGVGDAATRLDDERVKRFDLSLVGGHKDKRRLIAAGLATEDNCIVAGYAKYELVRRPVRLFANQNQIVLYNPHCRPDLSSWFEDGPGLMRQMERMARWNFIVAPHVKLERETTLTTAAPNILVDWGSVRSIDMTYTQAASIYLGDASSQVYEFLDEPRPCIFVNSHGIDWQGQEEFAHFRLGQVINRPEELESALARSESLQPIYAPLQRAAVQDSIDVSNEPASQRQAEAILQFCRSKGIAG